MLGFIPAWFMWLSGGYTAKAALDKLRPPQGAPGSAPGPGARGVAPMAHPGPHPGPMQPMHASPPYGPPQAFAPMQPMAPEPQAPPMRADAKFDPTMDARTEGAVLNCLQRGGAKDLRGFAQSVEAHFPIACWLMRQRALKIDHLAALQAQEAARKAAADAAERAHLAQQAQQAAQAAAAASAAPTPSKVNGAAAPQVPVVAPPVVDHPES
jgi:hypothetical protein